MSYDMLTTAAMRDELHDALVGGRVQSVVQSGALELALEVYAGERRYLVLNAEASAAGVWLMDERPRRGVEQPSPLLLLLRKYLEGARLIAVGQPTLERILRLRWAGAEGAVELVCEIMGRWSNVVLVDEGQAVMEALKRVPASLNRYRTILPHQPYVPPPPQDKAHPLSLSRDEAGALLGGGEGPLWRALVERVAGISPTLAREIAQRATGDAAAALPLAGDALAATLAALDALMRLPETRAWQPSVGLAGDGEARRPAAYAPYALTHYAAWEPMATLSAAIQRVRAAEAAYDPYGPARARLHGRIAAAAVRLAARLGALRRSLATLEEIEALQVQGNAILVMSATIRPGQRELVVDPVALGLRAEGHAELRISLDPALTPAENAQAVFRRYRKLQAAHGQVPALVTQTELELDYMRQLAAEADLAEDRGQLDEVERALGDALQPAAGARPDAPRGAPLRVTTPQGDVILVGRNSAQNQEITFRRTAPDDVWLHAQGIPGAHVVLKPVGGVLTEGALRAAAQLAAYYSAARHEARVLVAYTRRRHVRPIKGGRPGMVTYSQEQTLSVAPAPASAPTR